MPKPETQPPAKRPPLTLDEVTRRASAVALKHQNHQPTLIAEGSKKTIITQVIPLGETAERRRYQLFITGLALARSAEVGVLAQAFFISEAWMSESPDFNWPDLTPAQDPKRKEVLLISQLKVLTHEPAATILEMVRNSEGQLIELKALPSDDEVEQQVESPLLNAFIHGFLEGMIGTIKPS